MLENLKKIHFIGIGGVGMSALAYILLKRGFSVSGSDTSNGSMATKLSEEGAIVYVGHAACQVEDADAVVVSSAIHPDNPELEEARRRKILVLHRSDVLAALLNNAKGVAVAGAHGKTTTTSMLSCICAFSGCDPTAVIGGVVDSLGGNAINGNGELVVAEADESDGSFLKLHPYLAVVTNIENDHLDHYGTEENIYKAFCQFIGNVLPGGKAVLCFDNEKIRKLAQKTVTQVISYGIECSEADYRAENIIYGRKNTTYSLVKAGEKLGEIVLRIPGKHNVLNSLGALVAALELGIPLDKIIEALSRFCGARRRFETKAHTANGVWIVDDYAHHPTEVKATLLAARQTGPGRLICVFQPHRFTRTRLLLSDFVTAFSGCDELIITDIYAAGEDAIAGVSGASLAEAVNGHLPQKVHYIPSFEEIVKYLAEVVQPGDLVITVGAGNVYLVGEQLAEYLKRGNVECAQ